jgi:hypothetical protein
MLEIVAINSITRRMPLVVKAPKAVDVRVTGDFTGWAERGIRLSHDGGGRWRTVLSLEPGEYQYRLLGRRSVGGSCRGGPAGAESLRFEELRPQGPLVLGTE